MSSSSPNSPRPITIITGGASGIGRATVDRLAPALGGLTVVDFNPERVAQTLKEVAEKHPELAALGHVADVRKPEDMQAMADRTLEKFGRIDVLIHSAGILRLPGSAPRLMHEISVEECHAVIDTNLKGTFLSNRAVLPAMIKQRAGQIVNISSTSGKIGRAFDSVYCASKFGVVGLSEALAAEMCRYGVKVSVIMPDAVDTPLWDQNGPISAPDFSLPPDRVAAVIEYLIHLPADTVLENVIISPFRSRKRKVKSNKLPETEAAISP
jgi:NAD(P)-dependent dehydrogenase (short-subunit alcohol dehydrogenase family)